jgi:putative phage-type endonuclease
MAMTEKERQEFRNLTQSTPEWLVARRGRVTASRCQDVIRKLKNGNYSADRYAYMMDLVVEHLTGRAIDTYVNQAMEWGIEQQPFAQAAYEMRQDVSVESVGLIVHPSLELFAASPDGLVGENGLVEFKCPTSRVHIEYLKAGVVPEEYIPQMNAQMACMPEREYCDFVSFDPRVPFGIQLFIRRHYRDKGRIEELEFEVNKFLAELASELMALAVASPVEKHVEAELISLPHEVIPEVQERRRELKDRARQIVEKQTGVTA